MGELQSATDNRKRNGVNNEDVPYNANFGLSFKAEEGEEISIRKVRRMRDEDQVSVREQRVQREKGRVEQHVKEGEGCSSRNGNNKES